MLLLLLLDRAAARRRYRENVNAAHIRMRYRTLDSDMLQIGGKMICQRDAGVRMAHEVEYRRGGDVFARLLHAEARAKE
jgi:hypothetical protein